MKLGKLKRQGTARHDAFSHHHHFIFSQRAISTATQHPSHVQMWRSASSPTAALPMLFPTCSSSWSIGHHTTIRTIINNTMFHCARPLIEHIDKFIRFHFRNCPLYNYSACFRRAPQRRTPPSNTQSLARVRLTVVLFSTQRRRFRGFTSKLIVKGLPVKVFTIKPRRGSSSEPMGTHILEAWSYYTPESTRSVSSAFSVS